MSLDSYNLYLYLQVRQALSTWRLSNTSLLDLELLAPDELSQVASGGGGGGEGEGGVTLTLTLTLTLP